MAAPVHLARFVWDGAFAGSFEPEGPVATQGAPRPYRSPVLAARFVIGFHAIEDATGALEEMIHVARDVRGRQAPGDVDPLVTAQGGFYRHREASGDYRAEAGGQVVVIDADSTPRKQFEAQMVELAETIARWFSQPLVVLELQQDAATLVVHHVSA